MNKKQFYAGIVSLGLAVIFTLLNLTQIKTSFGETFLTNISIYPVAFFALLGVILMLNALKSFRKN